MDEPPLAPQGRLRWHVVSRTVGRLAPASILELGCGLGSVGVRLARLGAYTAAEPDEQCWSVASERIKPLGGEVIHGDHDKVPAGRTFDLVCAFEVLEHIADDEAALAHWMGFVRPGGHLLLSVPAGPERFGPADELVGHFRRYTAGGLEQLLSSAGADQVRVRHYGWPLGYLLEGVRNRMASRRVGQAANEAAERTSTSGRTFQPRTTVTGTVIRLGVAPFARLQELRPGAGPGIIALARRPLRPDGL
jgi:SAM-dependent methyltransferase